MKINFFSPLSRQMFCYHCAQHCLYLRSCFPCITHRNTVNVHYIILCNNRCTYVICRTQILLCKSGRRFVSIVDSRPSFSRRKYNDEQKKNFKKSVRYKNSMYIFFSNRIDLEPDPVCLGAIPSGGGAKLLSPVSRMPPSPVSLRHLDLELPLRTTYSISIQNFNSLRPLSVIAVHRTRRPSRTSSEG